MKRGNRTGKLHLPGEGPTWRNENCKNTEKLETDFTSTAGISYCNLGETANDKKGQYSPSLNLITKI